MPKQVAADCLSVCFVHISVPVGWLGELDGDSVVCCCVLCVEQLCTAVRLCVQLWAEQVGVGFTAEICVCVCLCVCVFVCVCVCVFFLVFFSINATFRRTLQSRIWRKL